MQKYISITINPQLLDECFDENMLVAQRQLAIAKAAPYLLVALRDLVCAEALPSGYADRKMLIQAACNAIARAEPL